MIWNKSRIVLLVLLNAIFVSQGYSSPIDPTFLSEKFTSLCVSEKSVGFLWEDNDWKQVDFKESKFTISRVMPSDLDHKPDDLMNYCTYEDAFMLDRSVMLGVSKGCYKLKHFDESYSRTTRCFEHWKASNGSRKVDSVTCYDFNLNFRPNGWFHGSYINAHLEDEADYKDTNSVTIGRCSIIETE